MGSEMCIRDRNELGMVYPERDQVITYDAGVSEYVKQYHDIP